MRIYVSSSYAKQHEMREHRDALARLGHIVTSSWIGEETTVAEKWHGPDSGPLRRRLGFKDLAEIMACDLLISDHTVQSVSGGLHSELGMALALTYTRFYDMQIWTVGNPNPRSPFFEMADRHFDDWAKLMEALRA